MIYFVRHGQSEYNLKKIHQGQTDNPLTELGENQAKDVAERLKDFKFDIIVASPLIRAKKTAEIINEQLSLPISFDARLMERGKGTMAGTPYSDDNKEDFERDPKKYGGETIEEFYDRCTAAFKDIEKLGKDVLIVAHGGVYRQIFKYVNGLDVYTKINDMKNCEVYVCEKDEDIEKNLKNDKGEL